MIQPLRSFGKTVANLEKIAQPMVEREIFCKNFGF
jgi:hypothetical protein